MELAAYPVIINNGSAQISVDQVTSAVPGTTLTLGTVAMNGAYTLTNRRR